MPRAAGDDNYQEWYDAVVGKIPQAESNFSLAGPMTETILLGVMAQTKSRVATAVEQREDGDQRPARTEFANQARIPRRMDD